MFAGEWKSQEKFSSKNGLGLTKNVGKFPSKIGENERFC